MAIKSPEFHTRHNRSEAKSKFREVTLSLDFIPGYLRVQGCTVALTFQDSGGSEKVIRVRTTPSQGGNRSYESCKKETRAIISHVNTKNKT